MLKKVIILLSTICLQTHIGIGQVFQSPMAIGPNTQISILEINRASDQLYQAFGHIAIHIEDKSNFLDRVYSYGAFDFSTESFYWKFITGRLPYQLTVSNMQYTLLEYGQQYENRTVTQHILNLSATQKQRVFDILEENYLPQNRTYQYKFFNDNCSTRIRDVFQKAMGDSLVFGQITNNKETFRHLMSQNLQDMTLPSFFMNIAIGLPSDKVCSNADAMYIPARMAQAFAKGSNGGKALIKTSNVLYKDSRQENITNLPFGILFAFGIYLLFFVLQIFYPKAMPLATKSLFFCIGIVGLLIVFLWFFTAHGVTRYNLSILWAWPTHIWAAFKLKNSSLQKYLKLWFYSILAFVALLIYQKTTSLHTDGNLMIFIIILALIAYRYMKAPTNKTNISS
jgi:hypothetical protein